MKTVSFVFDLLGFAFKGLILKSLWGWFLVPLGVVPIGYWHAIGIAGLVQMLCFTGLHKVDIVTELTAEQEAGRSIGTVLAILITWFIMWLVHFGVTNG